MPTSRFCRNHWIAFQLQPKLGKICVLDKEDIRRIHRYPRTVSEFFYLPYVRHANFSTEVYIHKLAFHFFLFEIGLTSSTFIKEKLSLATERRK